MQNPTNSSINPYVFTVSLTSTIYISIPLSCSVAFSLNFRRSSQGPFSGTTGGNKGYVEFDFYRFLFSILDTTMEESLRVREGRLKGFIMYSLGEVMHAIVLFESFCVTDHLPLP